MPITVKNILELFEKDVFTTRGFYAGKVKDIELDLAKNRIRAIVVETAKGSFLEAALGGRKNVVVPYSLISAIGDIVLIKFEAAEIPKEVETK